ncbi:tRNA (cytidine(34)-2'-O)-methyltransferase [Salinispira pacifica]
MKLHIVLVQPEIPQNTGNVARTCAAIGAVLHLVEPIGFSLEDRYLRRAGVDYWHLVEVRRHTSLAEVFRESDAGNRLFASAHGMSCYSEVEYPDPCFLFFGPESTGLDRKLIEGAGVNAVRIPMVAGARSLNLSNSVAIIAYEAARRHRFEGLSKRSPGTERSEKEVIN